MKVLCTTPLLKEVDGRARLYGRALQSQFNLSWADRLDHFICNGGDDYFHPWQRVTDKYNAARQVALDGGYTHLLTLEHDVIVPPDALKKLLDADAPICYALYVLRHKLHNTYPWNAMTKVEGQNCTSLSEDVDAARKSFGSVINVAGIGLGCTLIRRDVLEALSFRTPKGTSCDWALSLDAQAMGIQQVCDTSVCCAHMTLVPSPRIYHVDVDAPELYRVEYL